MKVLHIQYAMTPSGNAAYRLHEAMRAYGIDSRILTIEPSVERDFVFHHSECRVHRLLRESVNKRHSRHKYIRFVPNAYFYSDIPLMGRGLNRNAQVREADVIYFHWVAGNALSMGELEAIAATGKPIIFYNHDMWNLTGGCHHSFDCTQYASGCGNCPMMSRGKEAAANHIVLKQKVYSKHKNIVFVSPGHWMDQHVKASFSTRGSASFIIPNLIDDNVFFPMDKREAKRQLQLPEDKKIVTFGCQAGTANPFKGWDYLRKAINMVEHDDIQVVIFGSDYNEETQRQVRYPITFLGSVHDERRIALICNATDVFVSPSLVESFGMTFLENIKCGTPVVGFDNSGIPEIVQTGKVGYLARNMDSADLARGIVQLLDTPIKPEVNPIWRKDAIIAQHKKLIEQLLGKKS